MPRCFRCRNYGVYVLRERGQPHHRPHAHIKNRGRRIAAVYLETLTIYNDTEPLPDDLVERIKEEQGNLLRMWMELNEDD